VRVSTGRGGSFNNNWNNVRVANRNNNNPNNRNNNIGFRCAGVAPGEFLKGQVRLVHGRGASAEREKVQACSRLGLSLLWRLNQRQSGPALCGRLCGGFDAQGGAKGRVEHRWLGCSFGREAKVLG